MPSKRLRHVMGLSGGKDSSALAVYIQQEMPEIAEKMEYFFCDTHKELPETYEYLERLEARLGIKIIRLEDKRGFDHWLQIYGGYLPSSRMRWCTKQLKLLPFEQFVGDDDVITYVGIRADEDREGYKSRKDNIKARFPFKEAGLIKDDIIKILEDSGLGMPSYYKWRSRSGCFFCFFQRKYEWVMLSEKHPDLFEKAKEYEQDHTDGRNYTWNDDITLDELIKRKDDIIKNHQKYMERELFNAPNKPLTEALADVLNIENSELPCLECHL